MANAKKYNSSLVMSLFLCTKNIVHFHFPLGKNKKSLKQKENKNTKQLRNLSTEDPGPGPGLDQISHIHGHFVNLSTVVLLNISEDSDVVIFHEVDGHTFSAISPRTTNPVDVQLSVVG